MFLEADLLAQGTCVVQPGSVLGDSSTETLWCSGTPTLPEEPGLCYRAPSQKRSHRSRQALCASLWDGVGPSFSQSTAAKEV